MDDDPHHEIACERVFSRWISSEERPAPLAKLVRATAKDARPAIESALFVVEMGRDAGEASLELHEAAAMWTLLGRLLGGHAKTATYALEYSSSIFEAMAREGFDAPPAVRASLEAVFTEGYVLAREERARAALESEHLSALVPRRVAEGVELLVLTGPYDSVDLGDALEAWVRGAFRGGVKVAIVDLLGARGVEAYARALRETCLVLASLGVETLVVGGPPSLALPPETKRTTSFEEALAVSLSAREISSLAMARVRRLFTRARD